MLLICVIYSYFSFNAWSIISFLRLLVRFSNYSEVFLCRYHWAYFMENVTFSNCNIAIVLFEWIFYLNWHRKHHEKYKKQVFIFTRIVSERMWALATSFIIFSTPHQFSVSDSHQPRVPFLKLFPIFQSPSSRKKSSKYHSAHLTEIKILPIKNKTLPSAHRKPFGENFSPPVFITDRQLGPGRGCMTSVPNSSLISFPTQSPNPKRGKLKFPSLSQYLPTVKQYARGQPSRGANKSDWMTPFPAGAALSLGCGRQRKCIWWLAVDKFAYLLSGENFPKCWLFIRVNDVSRGRKKCEQNTRIPFHGSHSIRFTARAYVCTGRNKTWLCTA